MKAPSSKSVRCARERAARAVAKAARRRAADDGDRYSAKRAIRAVFEKLLLQRFKKAPSKIEPKPKPFN
jgi:hypothetical protein